MNKGRRNHLPLRALQRERLAPALTVNGQGPRDAASVEKVWLPLPFRQARWGVSLPIRLAALSFFALLALLAAGCGLPGTIPQRGHIADAGPRPTAAPLPPISFPQDEAPHRNLTEWWYYTGHFHGADAQGKTHEYGFELTVFQTLRGQVPPFYAAHFAISDISRGEFHYDQRVALGSLAALPEPGSTNGFDLGVQEWRVKGLNGADTLNATMADYTIALNLKDALPHAVEHGGNGLITYGLAGYSYYYSRPLMSLSGQIQDHGAQIVVTGQAWFDHQWGNFVTLTGSGWDWFSIQLDNRTQYMLYVIRDAQKKPISLVGTAVDADGTVSEIPSEKIETTATGSWTSPQTGGVYPSGWKVTLPSRNISLSLTPALRDQELVTTQSTGVAYWEGAVRISGQANGKPVTGQGYVELTGYAQVPSGAQGPNIP
jgi:predicted secreted hydrolase